MPKNIQTIIFDLDGTIYQNTVFHRDYLRFLVKNTPFETWESSLVEFADSVFAGKRLLMNNFYRIAPVKTEDPEDFFRILEKNLHPKISYKDALQRPDLIYLGDGWSVVTFLGEMLDLFSDGRQDLIYRKTRLHMEKQGMQGNPQLKVAITRLSKHFKIILLSNSHESTAREFLNQLGYHNLFPFLGSDANKPYDLITTLKKLEPKILSRPETILSIGDHAYNDLMPIKKEGGQTVWINPFPDIERPECDLELATLNELASFLDTLTSYQ